MILVKDVDTVNLPKSMIHEIIIRDNDYINDVKPTDKYDISEKLEAVKKEVIHGTVYRNARGEEVVVGMSKKVQQAIGLPMSVFRDMNKFIESKKFEYDSLVTNFTEAHNENNILRRRIDMFYEMTFWQRLKFLFLRR